MTAVSPSSYFLWEILRQRKVFVYPTFCHHRRLYFLIPPWLISLICGHACNGKLIIIIMSEYMTFVSKWVLMHRLWCGRAIVVCPSLTNHKRHYVRIRPYIRVSAWSCVRIIIWPPSPTLHRSYPPGTGTYPIPPDLYPVRPPYPTRHIPQRITYPVIVYIICNK